MKNTKRKARRVATGFSLWRRTRDSLSLRGPNQPSRAVVRSASSTAAPLSPSLYRPQDALGDSAHAARHACPRRSGSNLSSLLQEKKVPRRCVIPFSGGGQEIRNTPETFHLVPRSVKKSGFKPFLQFHISRVFTSFHQNKGHVKDTESSSSTAAVIRQRLFLPLNRLRSN